MAPFDVKQARKRIAHRREALIAVDQMVERLYNEVAATGRSACFMFTSDNGYLTGEHRIPTGKMLPYEESLRVPLIISCPGLPMGVTRSHLVNNTDLVATILDLAGATAGTVLDGKSLVPIMLDASIPWRAAILFQGNIPPKLGQDEEDGPGPMVRYQGVRTRDAKYVEYTNGEKEFYYLKNDPVENYNRAADPNAFPQVRSSLDQALDILRTCAGESCWMPAPLPAPKK